MKTLFGIALGPMLCTLVTGFCLIGPVAAQADPVAAQAEPGKSIQVGGEVSKPRAWSPEQLERDFGAEIKTLIFELKGQRHTARGIPLLSLLQAAEPRFASERKHPEVNYLVRVKGRDGYLVTFSLGELLPALGNRELYLAWSVDGEPLSAENAPARLIALGEQLPTRWIYAIESITLLDGASFEARDDLH